jgi:hypothetical protein
VWDWGWRWMRSGSLGWGELRTYQSSPSPLWEGIKGGEGHAHGTRGENPHSTPSGPPSPQGGERSTAGPAIASRLDELFPEAELVRTDVLGSVGLGLAMGAKRKFGVK